MPVDSSEVEEVWRVRSAKRLAAVQFVKSTPDYLTCAVRPSTPDPYDRAISKRTWEIGVRVWRRMLALQPPPRMHGGSPDDDEPNPRPPYDFEVPAPFQPKSPPPQPPPEVVEASPATPQPKSVPDTGVQIPMGNQAGGYNSVRRF